MKIPTVIPGLLLLALAVVGAGLGCAERSPPKRDVVVGVYQNSPKIYIDEHGEPAGLFIDLLREIARQEHWVIHYTPCAWDECLQALKDGQIDLMPDMAFSEQRRPQFDFHAISVASSWSQILTRERSGVHDFPDLAGLRVAVLRGSVQEGHLKQVMGSLGLDFVLVPVESLEQAFSITRQGQADAVVSNRFFAERHAARYQLRETPIIFHPTNLYFATAKGRNADLLARIDAHLARWRQDPESVYFEAMKRAMLPPPTFAMPPWARWALGVGGVLILSFIVMTLLLRWQVRQRTEELRQTAQRLERVLQSSPVVLYSLRRENGTLTTEWVSDNIQTLFGFTAEQALAPGWWQRQLHPDDRHAATASFAAIEKHPHLVHEYRILDARGRVRHIRDEMQFIPGPNPKDGMIVGTWSDQTMLHEQAERLDYLTHHDPLTGLPNRRLLHDRLQHAIERAQDDDHQLAVIYIDLDRFKNINDTLGHSVGDAFLRLAVERMLSAIPAGATLARVGGDEFVLLLEGSVSLSGISNVARRLLQLFASPMAVGPHELTVTASLGISLYPNDGTDVDTLLKHGEIALYEAKKQGRNTFRFFSAELSAGVLERLVMENELRGAIKRNELILHYQPQVDLETGALVGAEALVRWQHPDIGLVSPARFIPIAEETGLISDIGSWVVTEACRQMRRWTEEGLEVPRISVNVSVHQIERETLIEPILQALRATGMQPTRLELEVTESTIMREPASRCSAISRPWASNWPSMTSAPATQASPTSSACRWIASRSTSPSSVTSDRTPTAKPSARPSSAWHASSDWKRSPKAWRAKSRPNFCARQDVTSRRAIFMAAPSRPMPSARPGPPWRPSLWISAPRMSDSSVEITPLRADFAALRGTGIGRPERTEDGRRAGDASRTDRSAVQSDAGDRASRRCLRARSRLSAARW